jgi:CRP-like cAMP-binding protein
LPQVRARISEIDLVALYTRRDALVQEVAQGERAEDGAAFANAKQLDLQARVASARAAVVGTDPDLESARERVRLASGALTWQLAQDFPDRLWAAQKALGEINDQLDQAQLRDAELAIAQRDEPARFEAFAKRITALTPLLQTMIARVAVLRQEQQIALQDIAVAELTREKERLEGYSTQARFSVAQLYDRANDQVQDHPDGKPEASHAPKP